MQRGDGWEPSPLLIFVLCGVPGLKPRPTETISLLGFDEVVGDGEEGKFQAGGDAGFVEDVGKVPFDGFFGKGELLGDVAVGAAFNDAADDFHFAGGEAVGLLLGGGGLLHEGVEGADEVDDALAADPVVACHHGADGGLEVVGEGVLEDDAACADLQGFDDLLGGDGGGEEDDFDRAGAIHDGAHGFEAREARHGQVEQEDVGFLFEGLGDGLVAVGGFADNGEAAFLSEHVSNADAYYGVVICQHDANYAVRTIHWGGNLMVTFHLTLPTQVRFARGIPS